MTIAEIIRRLTTNDDRFNHLVWVGKDYSKADLCGTCGQRFVRMPHEQTRN